MKPLVFLSIHIYELSPLLKDMALYFTLCHFNNQLKDIHQIMNIHKSMFSVNRS